MAGVGPALLAGALGFSGLSGFGAFVLFDFVVSLGLGLADRPFPREFCEPFSGFGRCCGNVVELALLVSDAGVCLVERGGGVFVAGLDLGSP